METSILTSTKKILGIAQDYVAFDLDVITHINAALSTLTQLGVGPASGFMIEDAGSDWSEFLDDSDPNQALAKTYVHLKVRMLFDPPATSYLLNALNEQLTQFEWRLSVNREEATWVDPDPPVRPSDVVPYTTWGEVVYG